MNTTNQFNCKICNSSFIKQKALITHIWRYHKIKLEQYYNTYLNGTQKTSSCLTCGRPTKFMGINKGYQTHCSLKCGGHTAGNKLKYITPKDNFKRGMLKSYGVENCSQLQSVQNIKKTK